MNVLIVDSDDNMVALLTSICVGVDPRVRVHGFSFVQNALDHWEVHGADLILADVHLSDGSSLELIRRVRRSQSEVPVLMISRTADRESILKAARLGISGFVSKPFSVELLHQRLRSLLPQGQVGVSMNLNEHIAAAVSTMVQLPGTPNTAGIIELLQRSQNVSAAELVRSWRNEVSVTARLLAVAGSISFRRSGLPVTTLKDAILALGVPMALNHALALSLDICGQLAHPLLAEKAKELLTQAVAVADGAYRLALKLGEPAVPCHTAGLLSRAGDLAALKLMQQYCDSGDKTLSAEEIDQALADWAQPLGNQIKVHWRLPLPLRELIGAVHFLPRETVSQSKVIMRAAGLYESGLIDSDDGKWLMRRLGLEGFG
ncbi:response regulator [Marinobacter sp. M3C]|jgi:HD-like signal output (HDOD) protein/CheY-like chemotaxis protein|uniref:HDOD domain-containing protein n=1 Tax=unclassified Marinobacter TaxID=83889 RepID=UPI00200E1747|nr:MULTISPECIES: HDOD domain-containing protein [unclassified Marinobacter]MCL1481994.1 response regulator [Marinobacter sp.]MCL1489102.1 response regulator [Marinobacter sp.]UQG55743.1 response regulator [Marinobacter sp. M4C]UQG58951.1 response regulator [Marinobacter sp. M3C]UQG64547.1 response regulator [Marinobacter sp. M2C]